MRIAIIDLGTNTFNLLVAEFTGGKQYSIIYNEKIAVKLGEGGINKGYIAEQPFLRGLQAFGDHMKIVRSLKVEHVLAFGTSALRNASNGAEFASMIFKRENVEVNIIDGNREAEYIYLGVREAVTMNDTPSLILDIGGGSNEFIIATGEKILWKQSFELGAARLLERFSPSDPITDDEHQAILSYLETSLEPLWQATKKFGVAELIGSSGSFESLAEMIGYRFHQPDVLEGKTEYVFDLGQCEVIYYELLHSTKTERLGMKGLIPMRVDMIVVSAILVQLVIEKASLQQLRLSTFSLKEGVMSEWMNSRS